MDSAHVHALALAARVEPTPEGIAKLGTLVGGDLARWAVLQAQLRERAQTKFSRAAEMLFIREALEQASSELLASWHACLFPAGELVADLTCGIGSDLIALARRGPAIGFDVDSERSEYARHNCSVYGAQAEVRTADSMAVKWEFAYAYADPSRRVGGKRTPDLNAWLPNPAALAERMRLLRLGVIKLSPLTPDHALSELSCGLRFVGVEWECREAVMLLGTEAPRDRKAVLIESGEELSWQATGGPQTSTCGEYLYEAHPAAIRAHTLGELCSRNGLAELGDSNGYLTGNCVPSGSWLRRYRVLEVGPLRQRRVVEAVRRLGGHIEAVKCRGVKLDVRALALSVNRAVGRKSGPSFVIIAFPIQRQICVAIAAVDDASSPAS